MSSAPRPDFAKSWVTPAQSQLTLITLTTHPRGEGTYGRLDRSIVKDRLREVQEVPSSGRSERSNVPHHTLTQSNDPPTRAHPRALADGLVPPKVNVEVGVNTGARENQRGACAMRRRPGPKVPYMRPRRIVWSSKLPKPYRGDDCRCQSPAPKRYRSAQQIWSIESQACEKTATPTPGGAHLEGWGRLCANLSPHARTGACNPFEITVSPLPRLIKRFTSVTDLRIREGRKVRPVDAFPRRRREGPIATGLPMHKTHGTVHAW